MPTSHWKLLNPESAAKLISNDLIGESSIDDKPIGLDLQPSLSFDSGNGALALNARGRLSVVVLNDPKDDDEDGLLRAGDAEVVDGQLPPQLVIGNRHAWLKYRAEAGVKGVGDVSVGEIIAIDVEAERSAIFADYRIHDRKESARAAFVADLKNPARFVTNLSHVKQMEAGEALAFRLKGALSAAVTVSWSDVFTGQIGSLGAMLGTSAPIALSFKAGASVTAEVQVSDDFLIVISRVSPQRWRAGLRKVKSSRVAPSMDAGIEVGFADPAQIEKVLGTVIEGALGAPLAKVKQLLKAGSLESLGTAERKLAVAAMERLGLKPAIDTLDALRQRVDDLQKRVGEVVKDVARTRIGLSFAYEYSRVSEHLSLLQITLSQAALTQFHADLIRARTLPVTTSIAANDPGLTLELYLNQKTLTRERSWGFTLGLGKWARVGGKDFKQMSVVQRFDLKNRVQESYLGVRGYKGSWAGERIEWGVDLKADMKDYASEPKVSDYSFGLHLLWAGDLKRLSVSELEEWLDAAIIWRVMSAADIPDIRGRLAKALNKKASLSLHLTVPNTVLRSTLPSLASVAPEAYAAALATAMPWMKDSLARTNASRRRHLYTPLWTSYLRDPEQSVESLAARAAQRLKAEGHDDLVLREKAFLTVPDPFSFAGLTRINGNTRGACDAFTRGARIINAAIESGARNQKTIDKAVSEMNDLWTQSHHVRAMGVYLLDAAQRVGQVRDVTRTLTMQQGAESDAVVVTA